MSLPDPKCFGYTIEDWKTWEGRWELIQGVPFAMTPSPSFEHQEISMQLGAAILRALEDDRRKGGSGLCKVVAAPMDLYLPGEQSVYQPDLVIVCDPGKITSRGIEGAPELVVEILSPSTAMRDMNFKRKVYEAAGIKEYLIVNPAERAALLLGLVGGRYEERASVSWGEVLSLVGGTLSVPLGSPEQA